MYTDEELMARYLDGDQEAFTTLHQRYDRCLGKCIRGIFGRLAPGQIETGAIADILQDVFMYVHRFRAQSRSRPIKPWLFTCARRLTRNYLKALQRKRRDYRRTGTIYERYGQEGTLDDEKAPRRRLQKSANVLGRNSIEQEAMIATEATMAACLARLPIKQQIVLQLIFFQSCTAKEIAQRLGIPRSTVNWRKREALKHLRRIYPT